MTYKYIEFSGVKNPGGKTKIWLCRNKDNQALLGVVKWNGRWRQYCFFPAGDTVFSTGCMEDICDFIKRAMEKWRKEKFGGSQ